MAHTFANALALVASKERHISFEEEGIKTHTHTHTKTKKQQTLIKFQKKTK